MDQSVFCMQETCGVLGGILHLNIQQFVRCKNISRHAYSCIF